MYRESTFWVLAALAALFYLTAGMCVGADRRRAALASFLVAVAITVETVNSFIGFQVQVVSTTLHTVHSTAPVDRTTSTAPFHVAFGILLLLAALITPFGGRRPQEWHNE